MRVEYREVPCRTALNRVKGMPFAWSLNPYTGCAHRCTFCYVRHFEERADRPGDERYGRAIRIKTNVAHVLRAELARPSWRREEVAIGAATDPYQPCEGRYRLTRSCLVELSRSLTPFGIVTRGPLIRRDIDVLQEAARRVRVSVSVSLPTLDGRVWRTTEPGTASPHARLAAVEHLAAAGIDVGVAVAPVLPGLSDDPDGLAAVVRAARDAGARSIWCAPVHLRPGAREHFLATLSRDWPDEVERYQRLFAGRSYLSSDLGNEIRSLVRGLATAHPARRIESLRPAPGPVQLTLAV